jgi:hypothetical protein
VVLLVLAASVCSGLLAWAITKRSGRRKRFALKSREASYKVSYRNFMDDIVHLDAEGFSYLEGGLAPISWVKIRLIKGDQSGLDDFLSTFSEPSMFIEPEDRRDLLVSSNKGKRVIIQQPRIALVDAWNDLSSGSMVLKDLHMVFFSEIVTAIDESFEIPL